MCKKYSTFSYALYCQNRQLLPFYDFFAKKTLINVFVNHEESIETPPYFVIIFILIV